MRKSWTTLALSCLILHPSLARAEWDFWAVDYSGDPSIGNRIFTIDSSTGQATQRTTRVFGGNSWQPNLSYITENGNLVISNGNGKLESYNLESDSWENIGTSWKSSYQATFGKGLDIFSNEDGSTTIGKGNSTVIINSNGKGISTATGAPLIRAEASGEIHIGRNSLITKEEDGVQKLYAKDGDGKSIPIDITNGTDLLINGKSVQGQIDENKRLINQNTDNINNLAQGVAASTALTSALSSLPTVSDDSPFSCGVGTGGYSSRAAMGLGCAAKLNDRLSFNLGGSYVFGGTYSYGGGSLDTMAARGGFVFKLGKIDDSPKVAAKKAAKLHDLVSKVQEENEAIRSENIEIKTQNQQLQKLLTQQSALLAATQERLERLEQVAGINLSALGDRASR